MQTQTITTTRAIIRQLHDIGCDDWREAITQARDEESDFEAGGYRFIHEDAIDQIMQDELAGDEYVLGCFNAWFIADVLGIDTETVERMQAADGHSALGAMIVSLGKLPELQKSYAAADGYGHHFNSWDGSEEQVGKYYVFRTC